MKYLDKAPMVFTPARSAEKIEPVKPCDHKGRKQVFRGGAWRCECGAKV